MSDTERNYNLNLALTNGGRSLNAIWENKNLTANETFVLLFIGSKMDFKNIETASWWLPIEVIQEHTKLSRSTVKRAINSLVEKKYLDKQVRGNGSRPSLFTLGEKLFADYKIQLINKKSEGVHTEPPGGSHRPTKGVHTEPPGGSHRPTKYLSNTPKNTPINFIEKNDHLLINESKAIGALLFMPIDDGMSPKRYVDKNLLNQTMTEAYKRFGIDVLRHIRKWAESHNICHQNIFDPIQFEKLCVMASNNELQINPCYE